MREGTTWRASELDVKEERGGRGKDGAVGRLCILNLCFERWMSQDIAAYTRKCQKGAGESSGYAGFGPIRLGQKRGRAHS
jgi:hypothetical protein